MDEVTRWLNSSEAPESELFDLLYQELRKIAGARMKSERADHTLQPTALVHEAWIRLEKNRPEVWENRNQFFGFASEAMRRILVESARKRLAAKRGSGQVLTSTEDIELAGPLPDEELLVVHESLELLHAEDPTKANIVKLRFFGGLTHQEIAVLLEVNEKTVRRHWALAKIWLLEQFEKEIPS